MGLYAKGGSNVDFYSLCLNEDARIFMPNVHVMPKLFTINPFNLHIHNNLLHIFVQAVNWCIILGL
jgi:hypothetical protein